MASWILAALSLLLFTQHTCKASIELTSAHALVTDTRLPTDISPNSYHVELMPDLENLEFTGRVKINLLWQESTDTITLHAFKNLEILETKLSLVSTGEGEAKKPKTPVPITGLNVTHNSKENLLTIQILNKLRSGASCDLEIAFKSKLTKSTDEGLFYQEYYDSVTKFRKVYIATQFKPNFARKVFPCFDEPAFKSTFSLELTRQATARAVFNMPSENITESLKHSGWVVEKFQDTPVMPIYAFGMVIAEELLDNEVKAEEKIMEELGLKDVEIIVIASNEFKEKLQAYANQAAVLFSKVQQFWGVQYPNPKLHIVALPGFDVSQPVDNWGLIFLRENDFSSKSSWTLIQEIIYQWLGNYITPFWWSDALTNAALAQYLTAHISQTNNLQSQDNWPITMLYSIYYEYSRRYPDFRSGHMNRQASTGKTALVFRMFNYTVGSNVMQQALQKFMGEGVYKTFFAEDIWSAISAEAKFFDVFDDSMSANEIAGSWMAKERVPIVSVVRDYKNNKVNITQKLFLRQRPHDVPEQEKYKWWIPIVAIHEGNLNFSNTTPTAWMSPMEKSVILQNFGQQDKMVIVNPEEIAPYIVNYDDENWNKLATFLLNDDNRKQLPGNTRAKLLHDAWNIAYAGDLNFGVALNMTLFLEHEREYYAWDPMFTMVDHIGRHIDSFRVHKKFQAYVRRILSPMCDELGSEPVEGENDYNAHLRTSCRTFLCQVGYKPCIEQAQKQFRVWMESGDPDEGNPVPNAYICPVFKWGTREEWEFGLERVLRFPVIRRQSERTYLLKTLASCPNDGERIQKLLHTAILQEGSPFTENDIYLILSMLGNSHTGYLSLFDFLDKNFNVLKKRFENSKNLWTTLITSATAAFKSRDDMEKVTKFYKQRENDLGGAEIIVEKSMKNIKEEAKWADENIHVIEVWLDQFLKTNNITVDKDGVPVY